MALVVGTNTSALYSQNAMKTNARSTATTMERLSTGVRVNSAKDDAAGLAIGQNMTSHIRGLNQAVRNINDGINLVQTADGGLGSISDMLQRMRELAVQASNGTYSDVQREYLNKEAQQLQNAIGQVIDTTMWNDQKLLDGSFTGQKIQVGNEIGTTIDVSIARPIQANTQVSTLEPKKAWTKLLGTSSGDYAHALTTGLDGSIYVSGQTDGALDGQTNSGFRDVFLTKYSADGTKAWTKLLGGSSTVAASALTTGLDGSIFVNGTTYGALDGQTNSGLGDTFLTKYSADGTKAWTKLLGTSGSDTAYALTTGLDGSIYVSGTTDGALDGQTNSGGLDAFLTKFVVSSSNFAIDLSTQSGATNALAEIDTELNDVNGIRATLGSYINRLAYAADNVTNISSNATQSRSTIIDTDYAIETTNLAKNQIIQQAATAMLAQANTQPQAVMALLTNM